MQVDVVTLFPEMFAALTESGITGRAIREELLALRLWNPRDFTSDKHQTVDDRPYGGGPGMVMAIQPLQDAIEEARLAQGKGSRVVYLSPQGGPLDQQKVEELAGHDKLILLCGRYEGIDERLIQAQVDEEISIGDYVLSGGELPAMVLLDAMIRQLPGALGHEDSADEDSFAKGLLDCPHYTRPEHYAEQAVPPVLLSGNHEQIRRWRLKQSLGRTWQRRPELLESLSLDKEQEELLAEFIEESQASTSSTS
jgi:tRNA (guanine37-N1)-methyltransferase